MVLAAQTDVLRAPGQFQDVQPRAVAVGRVDEAAVVDFEVVGHVPVRHGRVGIGLGYVEGDLGRRLRLADVEGPDPSSEVGQEGHPAIVGIPKVLLARVHAEPRSPQAVVAPGYFSPRRGSTDSVPRTIGPCHTFGSRRVPGGDVFEFSTVTSTTKLQCGASLHRSAVASDESITMSRLRNSVKLP